MGRRLPAVLNLRQVWTGVISRHLWQQKGKKTTNTIPLWWHHHLWSRLQQVHALCDEEAASARCTYCEITWLCERMMDLIGVGESSVITSPLEINGPSMVKKKEVQKEMSCWRFCIFWLLYNKVINVNQTYFVFSFQPCNNHLGPHWNISTTISLPCHGNPEPAHGRNIQIYLNDY